jgi:hypothetical protein
MADLGHCVEELGCTAVGARRLIRVPGDDEDVSNAHLRHARNELEEVRTIEDEAGGKVGNDGIALGGKSSRELQRVV